MIPATVHTMALATATPVMMAMAGKGSFLAPGARSWHQRALLSTIFFKFLAISASGARFYGTKSQHLLERDDICMKSGFVNDVEYLPTYRS